jgi:hypothetical protein
MKRAVAMLTVSRVVFVNPLPAWPQGSDGVRLGRVNRAQRPAAGVANGGGHVD